MVFGTQCLCAFAEHSVEMGIARVRALKQEKLTDVIDIRRVEMGIARVRALKQLQWLSLRFQVSSVEMGIARVRALKQHLRLPFSLCRDG